MKVVFKVWGYNLLENGIVTNDWDKGSREYEHDNCESWFYCFDYDEQKLRELFEKYKSVKCKFAITIIKEELK